MAFTRWKPRAQQGSVVLEAAFFLSFMAFTIVVLTDAAAVMFGQLQLSAALHAGSIYAMAQSAAASVSGNTSSDGTEIAVAQESGIGSSGNAPRFTQGGCYVCYNDDSETASCVAAASSCEGRILFSMKSLTAESGISLLLSYPGFANPVPVRQTVYYPVHHP